MTWGTCVPLCLRHCQTSCFAAKLGKKNNEQVALQQLRLRQLGPLIILCTKIPFGHLRMPDKTPLGAEEVNRIAKEMVEKCIGNETYKHSDVAAWSNSIVDNVVQKLVAHDPAFKYIVSCVIVQKNGAGLNTATSCYWDNIQDRYFTIRWDNKHLHCIVHVFLMPL